MPGAIFVRYLPSASSQIEVKNLVRPFIKRHSASAMFRPTPPPHCSIVHGCVEPSNCNKKLEKSYSLFDK